MIDPHMTYFYIIYARVMRIYVVHANQYTVHIMHGCTYVTEWMQINYWYVSIALHSCIRNGQAYLCHTLHENTYSILRRTIPNLRMYHTLPFSSRACEGYSCHHVTRLAIRRGIWRHSQFADQVTVGHQDHFLAGARGNEPWIQDISKCQ